MKALSIRQPWAGAVALGWKDVENRTRLTSHRGWLLVHASTQFATPYAAVVGEIEQLANRPAGVPSSWGMPGASPAWDMGAIVGAVWLRAAHKGCDGSCSRWAQPGQAHWMLDRPLVLRRPVPCSGRLGLWTPDQDVLDQVKEAWPR